MDFKSVNGAVIKAQYWQVSKADLIALNLKLKLELIALEVSDSNANLRLKYLELLKHGRVVYIKRFLQRGK